MARPYVCEQCGYSQPGPLAFEVHQRLDETDDDGDPIEQMFDLCGGECLTNFAMGLSLDFPDTP